MSHTTFYCGDSNGVVHHSELMFLSNMLNIVNLGIGLHLVRHLVKVGKTSTGNIVIGGFITLIALTLCYDLTGLQEATDNTRIDMEAFIAIEMIVRKGLLLPCP